MLVNDYEFTCETLTGTYGCDCTGCTVCQDTETAATGSPSSHPTESPTIVPSVSPTPSPTPGHPCETGEHDCDVENGQCVREEGDDAEDQHVRTVRVSAGEHTHAYHCLCNTDYEFAHPSDLENNTCVTRPPTNAPTQAPTLSPTKEPTKSPTLPHPCPFGSSTDPTLGQTHDCSTNGVCLPGPLVRLKSKVHTKYGHTYHCVCDPGFEFVYPSIGARPWSISVQGAGDLWDGVYDQLPAKVKLRPAYVHASDTQAGASILPRLLVYGGAIGVKDEGWRFTRSLLPLNISQYMETHASEYDDAMNVRMKHYAAASDAHTQELESAIDDGILGPWCEQVTPVNQAPHLLECAGEWQTDSGSNVSLQLTELGSLVNECKEKTSPLPSWTNQSGVENSAISCTNKCGSGELADTCWCDLACVDRGDCCDDYTVECAPPLLLQNHDMLEVRVQADADDASRLHYEFRGEDGTWLVTPTLKLQRMRMYMFRQVRTENARPLTITYTDQYPDSSANVDEDDNAHGAHTGVRYFLKDRFVSYAEYLQHLQSGDDEGVDSWTLWKVQRESPTRMFYRDTGLVGLNSTRVRGGDVLVMSQRNAAVGGGKIVLPTAAKN